MFPEAWASAQYTSEKIQWYWADVPFEARSALRTHLMAQGYVPLSATFFWKAPTAETSGMAVSMIALPPATLRAAQRRISFQPLQSQHVSLIRAWMEQPHVQPWWKLPRQSTVPHRVAGCAETIVQKKPVQSFVIQWQGWPMGYIQRYDVRDFSGVAPFPVEASHVCAGLDWYIGDPGFLHKGWATPILQQFLVQHIWPDFKACLVDPDPSNTRAIQVYRRCHFHALDWSSGQVAWMLALRPAP